MLVRTEDVLQVTVHRTRDGGYSLEMNFNKGDAVPWSRPVLYRLCDGDDCFPENWQDANTAEFRRIVSTAAADVSKILKEANNAYVSRAVANGEPTITIKEVAAELSCGSTHVYNCVNTGDLPEPSYVSGKSVWLRSEVLAAKARMIAEAGLSKKHRPMNRHERRKAAAKAKAD